MIAPVVLTASSDPDSEPASEALSRNSAEAVGNAMPSTIVTGSTTSNADPNSDLSVVERLVGVERFGLADDGDQADERRVPQRAIWVTARTRTGSPSRAPQDVEDRRRRWRSRRGTTARITVNTYVVLPVPEASSRVQVTW